MSTTATVEERQTARIPQTLEQARQLRPVENSSVIEARKEMLMAGLELQLIRWLFFVPSWLGCLRPLEGLLAPTPLGAQYALVGKRPE